MKKRLLLLMVLLFALLLLAGCLDGETTERFTIKSLSESQTDMTADSDQPSRLPPSAEDTAFPRPDDETQPPSEPAAEPPETEPPAIEPPETAPPATEMTERTPAETEGEDEVTYIANTNSKKFHYPWCSSVETMKESNKLYFTGTREELIENGYEPCKRCSP